MSEELMLEMAMESRNRAYAPYSGFQVGACIEVKSSDGSRLFGGCNMENASYGATICAERGAVLSAVAQLGKPEILRVLVVSDAEPPAVPCALCLQVLSEFCGPDCEILLADLSGVVRRMQFSELLPHPFNEIPE